MSAAEVAEGRLTFFGHNDANFCKGRISNAKKILGRVGAAEYDAC